MSPKDKQEDLLSALERIAEISDLPEVTELCFQISGLVFTEPQGQEKSCREEGESSSSAVAKYPVAEGPALKGKAKVEFVKEPDWEPVPCLVTPLCKKPPSYSQVVGSCMQRPVFGPVTPESSSRPSGSRETGAATRGFQAVADAMAGTIQNAGGFNNAWDNAADDNARQQLETVGMNHPLADVRIAALMKRDARNQALIAQLGQNAQAAIQAANAAALAAQNAQNTANAAQAAQAGGGAPRFRPANPPKYANKKKDPDLREWLLTIEDFYRQAQDVDYLRLASSYLEGGPRSVWTTKYDLYKAGHGGAEPPQPRQFFRTALEGTFDLADREQKHWDTWNNLRMVPGQDISEYNVAFQSALADLAVHITDEQVKIEKYRSGLQYDMRELCRASPQGTRWATLQALTQFATLQWPIVSARVAKAKKSTSSPSAKKVAGKRKSESSPGGNGSKQSSSKAKVGAGKLSDEDRKHNMEQKLCHRCRKPGHQIKECPLNKSKGKDKGKVNAASGSAPADDDMEEDFAQA